MEVEICMTSSFAGSMDTFEEAMGCTLKCKCKNYKDEM